MTARLKHAETLNAISSYVGNEIARLDQALTCFGLNGAFEGGGIKLATRFDADLVRGQMRTLKRVHDIIWANILPPLSPSYGEEACSDSSVVSEVDRQPTWVVILRNGSEFRVTGAKLDSLLDRLIYLRNDTGVVAAVPIDYLAAIREANHSESMDHR